MKRARSDFSLLMKAAINGMNDIPISQLDSMQKNLRKNMKLILKSPMSLSRKILCIAFAANRKATNVIILFVKRLMC